MTEMLTIQPDNSAPAYEAQLDRSKRQHSESKQKADWHRKCSFEPPRFRSRVFTGREEINYENI